MRKLYKSFHMVSEQRGLGYKTKGCVAARMAEDWNQEHSCGGLRCVNDGTEKQKDEGSAASFPTTLDNAVDHIGPSSGSARICHTDALNVETVNHLYELSRKIENCFTWMKGTDLDDEQWYRGYDETGLENGLEFEDTSASRRYGQCEGRHSRDM